ncbi:growth hormone-inducible transmembrane protein [Neodiprion pinetum]|uniref:growth hormone-inducible transmembrane protein-like n=1 Tax=Neodiprion fabricii TaxID=2872261 RepID=UPI00076FD082|nr:growth hormone-inducible transmembrane protein-like [Neodiprion fabricii]XP_046412730.1 growth hormone-inducible transmembrane protein-like [Neodiprion fabricii]XP_046467988.1 growth hormone-inducible transmembrane protein-like [Neodiprion pinetum]XP_046467989.1 growth hormone-inducible transmembrane protein-like [Neodiprion pinetum]XP_046605936.1 growth hormone-inducible transmembrane protein-like [Neodiprion virginianus]XP_046605937.1 growth hormone-inducible transmembrane protein-like [N
MMLARVCRASLSPNVSSLLKTPPVSKSFIPKVETVRLLASDGRSSFTRSARKRMTIVERAMAPAGEGAYSVGKGALAGFSAVALGGLCYYGLGLSKATGAIDHAVYWPEHVKERIRATYMYFGGSILVTAASAAMCLRSPAMMNLVMRQGWLALGATMVAMIGSGMVAQSIPYSPGFGAKQIAWIVHTGIMGAVVAPMCLLGGPLVARAALYTAGVVGGLSTVAVCAPSDKFLYMGGPLAIGLGVVFVSSLGTMFLPPTTAFGAGLHSMALYGGLILFSGFLLYDTQRIIKRAETHPAVPYANVRPYDPINNAISIYLDTVNIFIRILSILAGGGNRKK